MYVKDIIVCIIILSSVKVVSQVDQISVYNIWHVLQHIYMYTV